MVNFSKSVTGKQKIDTGKKNNALEPNLLIREWESIAILRGLAKHITGIQFKKNTALCMVGDWGCSELNYLVIISL